MYATANETHDVGLRKYMTSIYNLMLMGLATSAGAAAFAAMSGLTDAMRQGGALFLLIALSPLAIVIAMMVGIERMRASTLYLLYWAFVILEGLGLSVVLARYTGGSILVAFTAAAAGFAGCSLYGYTTKRNLGPIGSFLTFALFGLIALMIIGIFAASPALDLFIGLAGVLIFAGLTAWDTQSLKEAYSPGMGEDERSRIVVVGALNLYLDFLNMFLFILKLIGDSKD